MTIDPSKGTETLDPAGIAERKDSIRRFLPGNFFKQRGQLGLDRDRSGHRRYAVLYEDLLA